MRIFLDANILVAVLCNEYPQFSFCSRVLSLCDNKRFAVFTSPMCLAIAFYFTERKNGTPLAKQKIALLASKLRITSVDGEAVKKAIANKAIHDFEDGLEYYSAESSKCSCIVTNDEDDFYFSKLEVLNAHDFLLKYAVKTKT
ncbi:MAG TPA: PIN domain-containing protein [Bacteroidia bacterium]|nr:PIN domain-containing protein [Bacteroidia bacterium]HNU33191.1 PIN domain-containing protein [Bacteroidia bacterium]